MKKFLGAFALLIFIGHAAAQQGQPVGPNPPAGLFTVNGVLSGNGSGTVTQGACSGLSNATVYCSSTQGQLPGIASNTAATAGNVGEYLSTNIASPGVSLSTTADKDVGTLVLTAGDWLCNGNVFVIPAGTLSTYENWIGTTADTAPTRPNSGAMTQFNNIATTSQIGASTGSIRILTSGATFHLGVNATFTVTATAYGFIGCVRTH